MKPSVPRCHQPPEGPSGVPFLKPHPLTALFSCPSEVFDGLLVRFPPHIPISRSSLDVEVAIYYTWCVELTSDQGVVYHLKHGLSKHVVSSSGFSSPPHACSSKTWNFPPLMPTQRTVLRFTPRPQVVLHCRRDGTFFVSCSNGQHKAFLLMW